MLNRIHEFSSGFVESWASCLLLISAWPRITSERWLGDKASYIFTSSSTVISCEYNTKLWIIVWINLQEILSQIRCFSSGSCLSNRSQTSRLSFLLSFSEHLQRGSLYHSQFLDRGFPYILWHLRLPPELLPFIAKFLLRSSTFETCSAISHMLIITWNEPLKYLPNLL